MGLGFGPVDWNHNGRLEGVTLLRADGSATYQLATVADDLDLGITHVIRGSDHRPNEERQRRIARALGGELPEVIGVRCGGGDHPRVIDGHLFEITCSAETPAIEFQIEDGPWRSVPIRTTANPALVEIDL